MTHLEDHEGHLYTPFPDLTGWRSSAAERGSTSSLVHASYNDVSLSKDDLEMASQRLGVPDAADLIVAAWVTVLTQLLSQEDDVDVHVYMQHLSHLHLCIPKNERRQYTLSSLLLQIREARGSGSAPDNEAMKSADNVVSVNLSDKGKPEKRTDTTLSFSAGLSEQGDHINLDLSASPMVHNLSSAHLHLVQVAACLKYICNEATPTSPAFYLQHYHTDLLAGDNPLPAPLLDDIEVLTFERFEHQMERVVARSPSNIALDFRECLEAVPGDESSGNYLWSYKELDRRAQVISSHLQMHLKRHDDETYNSTPIVALCLEKSPYTYLAIPAVLKAGAAWCPIDTDWPAARRKALLAKSGAKVILTAGDRISSETPQSDKIIIRLDTLDYSHKIPPLQASSSASSSDLAYLIWTSGTTGLPKAVGIQHKSAVQALRSLQRVIPHTGSDFRYLQFSAYNFDLMILDVFYTWGLGGTLCSGSRSLLLTKLVDLSNAFKVTHTLLTPAVLAMTPRRSIPSLQVVINGGEKLSQVVADTWSVDCCLLNLYGPAEATLIAMNRVVPRNDSVKAPNIGRALPTTSCHALNEDGDIVLKGAIGQLVLGGHQCAVGYIGEETKTREQFIQHRQLGRVYKTGDLVRQLWSGDFEYLGRSDDQIKVNGIRIELLEINNTIRNATDQVKDSETLVVKSSHGEIDDVQLINFSVVPSIVKRESKTAIRIDEDAIQVARQLTCFAASNLPSYMIPSLFIIVSHFPRTSSAKIDREALRKEMKNFDRLTWLDRLANPSQETSGEIKTTPQEETIRSHLAQLCGISENAFGRHTTFPSLGLNSIKAITLSHRLMQAGVSATVVDIAQCQTLASLAERVSTGASANDDKLRKTSAFLEQFDEQYRPAVSLYLQNKKCPSDVKAVLPVTPLQEALLSETTRDKSRYWLHRTYSLSPQIDIERLQRAIEVVVQRVDILRTCFVNTTELSLTAASPTTFVQVVMSRIMVKIVIIEEADAARIDDRAVLDQVNNKLALQATGTEPPLGFLIIKGKQMQLIAVLHHALYDQVTLGLIEESIAKCYKGGREVRFEVLPFSFALHHLISCEEEEVRQRREIWKNLLSQYPKGQAVSFPNLSGQEAVSNQSSTSRYHLKTSITLEKMNEVAKQLQTSSRPILQAAWAAILCAHCDVSNVIIGDSISARTGSMQLDHVAGPLLDTLPVPVCIDETYRIVITNLDKFHKRAISHLPVPLRYIREMVAIPNDFALFASVFVFDPPRDQEEQIGEDDLLHDQRDFGLSVEHSVAVDVTVEANGFFTLGLVVKDAVVSAEYAEIILSQWESAIHQAMKQPDSLASNFQPDFFPEELLSASKFRIPDSLDVARNIPVFTALSKWAISTPKAVAVEFHNSLERQESSVISLTYSELEQESTRFSCVLRDKVPAESVVAVCLNRSIETYTVLLAILKAGMTYLPIDPSLPMQRKNVLLKQSQSACLLWSGLTQWSLDEEAIVTIYVDSASFLDAASPPLAGNSAFDMSTPAYIIFTSGSTGTPKGCVLTHGNLSSAIEAFRLTYEEKAPGTLNQTTRFLARSVEAFDVALLEALLPLQVGGTIVTAPRNVILQDMARAMQVIRVTHAAVVPSLFYTEGRRIVPADLPCLKALIVGGERVAQDVIRAWAPSKIPLLNAYGPSEACIGTSIARLFPQDSTSNIGVPFPGTQYLILKSVNGEFRLALRGEAGELCIGGLQVGSYLGASDSTSFVQWNGQQIYRTGDEVRLRRNDITEYLGRSSSGQGSTQVKLRGVRIELSEVDEVVLKASELTQFCLTRVLGEPSYLVTFIAQNATSQMEGRNLHFLSQGPLHQEARSLAHVARDRLPSYMVPRFIVPLEQMPLSPISGKIDGKRLDVWYQSKASKLLQSKVNSGEDNRRALSQVEAIVKEEIQKLFPVDAYIGPFTDVFSLGLDSLNVISLSGILLRRGIKVDVSHIMSRPTVEAIAKGTNVQSNGRSEEQFDYTEQAQREAKVDITNAFPLLPLQESMITQTLGEKADGPSRYINIIRLACKEKVIDGERLARSIEDSLASHKIYKTVFIEVEGRMVQAVMREKPTWRLEEIYFEAIAVQQIRATLDREPPLRYCVTGSNEVLFAIHHALYDGESLANLLQEIQQRYYGEEIEYPDDFVQYVKEINGRNMESRLNAWKEILCESTVIPFPCLTGEKIPRKSSEKRLSVEHRPCISLKLLKKRAREEKITLQLIVVDAFARLYARYVGQDQVLFGLVLGGRTCSNMSTHGPCINTVPFTHEVKKKDRRRHLQSTYAKALSNQHISLPQLARLMQVQNGLFNTLFSYLGPIKSSQFFQETSFNLLTEYPFAVEVQELPDTDQIEFRAVFDPHFIPAKQAGLFLRQFEALLSSGDSPLTNNQVLAIENDQPVIPDNSSHFIAKFRSQVEQQPEAIAFVFSHDLNLPKEETMYRQLDQTSTAMASELIKIEGPVIGVLLKQCPALYPLLLAIWKAGKVYLPLDPSLPFERLAYMASIAKPASIISAHHDLDLAAKLGPGMCVDDLLRSKASYIRQVKEPDLQDTAYVMFTSGSSGKPKGVQISHLALASAIYSWSQILPHTSSSRMLQLASPGFDVFLIEVCMPLALGFSFASAAKEDLLDDLEATFNKLQLTMADLPAVLAGTVRPDTIRGQQPLQWLMSGGDIIEDRVIEQWSKHGLINAWGPTETTIGNTLGFVSDKSSRSWVGKAYPTSSLYVLDPLSTTITYRGCIGEIAVGGPQVADGYVGNAELTKEKFIVLSNGVRVYRTGDRGRLLYDGSLECLGRIDSGQVKINSQRVELREIELQLKQGNGILDALVLYLEHKEMQSKQLVAFVVVEGASHHVSEIRFRQDEQARNAVASCLDNAKESLASYMIPSLCLIVDGNKLPLTPNNKIDTRRLQDVYFGMTAKEIRRWDARSHQNNVPKEWSRLEKELRAIIADFCKVDEDEVQRDVSFYRLGIDSISGFRLLKRLREHGHNRLSLRDILLTSTIASLATLIKGQQSTQLDDGDSVMLQMDAKLRQHCDVSSLYLDPTDQIKRLLPCTPLQEGLLLESLSSGLYVHHHFFKVEEQNLSMVTEAIAEVVRSHDILRTSFHLVDGHFIQAVHSNTPFQLPDIIESTDMEKSITDLIASKHFAEEADLAKPLFTVNRIHSTGEGLVVIGFCLHHALYDGQTLEMIFEEVESRASGQKVQPRLSFERLLPHLMSRPEDERFIVDQVKDCQSTLLDSSRAAGSRHCHYNERILDIKMEALGRFASQTGVSIHIVALFAFVKLLCHLTDKRDVVFAQLFSLRDAMAGAENVIGPALNSTLTRSTLPDGETMQDALTRMQTDNDATRQHRRVSMAQVLRLARKNREGQSIEFDTLFDFQQGRQREDLTDSKGRILTPYVLPGDTASQYALNIQFRHQGESLAVVAVGDSNIFAQGKLESHLETLEEILRLTMFDVSRASTAMPSGLSDLNSLPFTSTIQSNDVKISTSKTVIRDLSGEEKIVLAVIMELMQTDEGHIDITTPINQFGLDSIMAIKLASRLRAKGLVVGVADVLQGKTVEGISRRVAAKKSKVSLQGNGHSYGRNPEDIDEAAQSLSISPKQIEAVLPLLPGQEFELAEYIKSEGRSGVFTFVNKVKIDKVDEARMKRAWKQLCISQAILRTSFMSCRGRAKQVVLADANHNSWQIRHLKTSISGLIREKEAWSEWITKACKIDSSLSTPPCAACFISASDGFFFTLRVHHALYDAWTVSFLMQELWRIYDVNEQDTHKSDYIGLVRHLIAEKELLSGKAKHYWRGVLEGVPPCIVGSKSTTSASRMATLLKLDILKDASSTEQRLRSKGFSLGTAFIAAWSKCMLGLFPSHDKVVFGLYRRGRSSDFERIETIASNCMNVLPLVIDRGESTTSDKLCHLIKHQMDGQTQYESTTSMSDILDWTSMEKASWNTYLNLVWDDEQQQQDDSGQHLEQVALPEYEQMEAGLNRTSDWFEARLGDMRSEININLHWDRNKDCIDAAVRYRCDHVSSQEVGQMITDMVSHFKKIARDQ